MTFSSHGQGSLKNALSFCGFPQPQCPPHSELLWKGAALLWPLVPPHPAYQPINPTLLHPCCQAPIKTALSNSGREANWETARQVSSHKKPCVLPVWCRDQSIVYQAPESTVTTFYLDITLHSLQKQLLPPGSFRLPTGPPATRKLRARK